MLKLWNTKKNTHINYNRLLCLRPIVIQISTEHDVFCKHSLTITITPQFNSSLAKQCRSENLHKYVKSTLNCAFKTNSYRLMVSLSLFVMQIFDPVVNLFVLRRDYFNHMSLNRFKTFGQLINLGTMLASFRVHERKLLKESHKIPARERRQPHICLRKNWLFRQL